MRTDLVALAALIALPAAADDLAPIGTFHWDSDLIAELSGIEVSDDGLSFTPVGDRGFWMTGRFERDGDAITGIDVDDLGSVLGENGFPVAARRVEDWSDSEGLAIADDGTIWVSFERWAHVWQYNDGLRQPPIWTMDHPTFYDHAENWQLEALALSPDGTLYTFSEKPLPEGFPIYRLENGAWTIDGYLPEQDLFSIVGADFDSSGDLYLLERKLVVGLWWQNRIRRVRLGTPVDEVLWTSQRDEYQNLEGLAVWRDAKGLRLTLVSDNGGAGPSQFVEFRLTD